MRKLISVEIKVEHDAFIETMTRIHKLYGVKDILWDPKALFGARSNGNAEEKRPYTKPKSKKDTAKGGVTGADYITQILFKNPMTHKEIQEAFGKDGRSPKSVNSVVHTMKKQGVAKSDEKSGKWVLTAKGRDRARYRLKHPQQPTE